MKRVVSSSYDFMYEDSVEDLAKKYLTQFDEDDLVNYLAVEIASDMDNTGDTVDQVSEDLKNYLNRQVDWIVDQMKSIYEL